MFYKGSNETYGFRKFKTIRVFGNEIRNDIINMSMANDEQTQLLKRINQLKVRQDHKILSQKKHLIEMHLIVQEHFSKEEK